jgi:hypothetical protein
MKPWVEEDEMLKSRNLYFQPSLSFVIDFREGGRVVNK